MRLRAHRLCAHWSKTDINWCKTDIVWCKTDMVLMSIGPGYIVWCNTDMVLRAHGLCDVRHVSLKGAYSQGISLRACDVRHTIFSPACDVRRTLKAAARHSLKGAQLVCLEEGA